MKISIQKLSIDELWRLFKIRTTECGQLSREIQRREREESWRSRKKAKHLRAVR